MINWLDLDFLFLSRKKLDQYIKYIRKSYIYVNILLASIASFGSWWCTFYLSTPSTAATSYVLCSLFFPSIAKASAGWGAHHSMKPIKPQCRGCAVAWQEEYSPESRIREAGSCREHGYINTHSHILSLTALTFNTYIIYTRWQRSQMQNTRAHAHPQAVLHWRTCWREERWDLNIKAMKPPVITDQRQRRWFKPWLKILRASTWLNQMLTLS